MKTNDELITQIKTAIDAQLADGAKLVTRNWNLDSFPGPGGDYFYNYYKGKATCALGCLLIGQRSNQRDLAHSAIARFLDVPMDWVTGFIWAYDTIFSEEPVMLSESCLKGYMAGKLIRQEYLHAA